jgi:rhodanese-related sulfurtransferase
VREQHEFNIARLPNFKLLPLSESSEWAPTIQEQLDPAAETIVLCHHGVRSMNAAMVSLHSCYYAVVTVFVRKLCLTVPVALLVSSIS